MRVLGDELSMHMGASAQLGTHSMEAQTAGGKSREELEKKGFRQAVPEIKQGLEAKRSLDFVMCEGMLWAGAWHA